MIDLSGQYLLAYLALVVWVLTIIALVAVVIVIARGALARARAEDIPEVLGRLTELIGAIPWLRQLRHFIRGQVDWNLPEGRRSDSSTSTVEYTDQPEDDDK
jgi:hypothetical protein